MASAEEKRYSDLLTPVVCDGCVGQNDVINYCLQCHANICVGCKSTHCDTRLTRNHIVLHRTHPEVVKARRSRKIYCQQHTGKEYAIYCKPCGIPCCTTCVIESHEGHKMSDLESVISDTESKINEVVHELETNVVPLFEKAISVLGEEVTSYERQMDDIKQRAKQRMKQLRQELDKAEEYFWSDVDNRGRNDLKIIDSKKLELESNLKKIKSEAANGKMAPVDASILFIKDELLQVNALRPNQTTCPGNPSFQMSTFQMPSAFDIIGSISNDGEKIFFDTSIEDQNENIDRGNFEYTRNVKVVKKIDKTKASTVVCRNDNEVLISANDKKCVDVYKENFDKVKTINLGFTCNDITINDSHDVIATDVNNKRIVRISNNSSTKLCGTAPLIPRVVFVNKKQEIVVGGEKVVGIGPWMLVVYSSDGSSVLHEIEKDQSREELFTGRITRVRQTVSGEYVVADGSRMICFSGDWKINWTYEFGPYCDVWALCCLTNNNILVGDIDKNEIVMLNKDGELMGTLLTKDDGICYPQSIDEDSKGCLWIGQKENVLIATNMK